MVVIRRNSFKNVARVTKKLGKTGEVRVEPIRGFPFLLEVGMHVYLTPPPLDGIRSSRVEKTRKLDEGWGVRFEDSKTAADAFSLIGRYCLVATDDLRPPEDDMENGGLIGLDVIDAGRGHIGIVSDLIVGISQTTLMIDTESGECLVPLVDEYVKGISLDAIEVSIPDELYDLNR